MGFTLDEIKANYKDHITAISKKKEISEKDLLDEIERHYNGYKYNVEAENKLFNAFAIQNYFKNQGKVRNYFAESGATHILLKSLKQQAIPDLRNYLDLMEDQAFTVNINDQELGKPKEWGMFLKDFKQLAFDAGYLTVDTVTKKSNEIALKVPNYEVFQNFQELLENFLIINDKFGFIISSLKRKDFKRFFYNLEEVAFRDKTFLKLDDKEAEIKEDSNYEKVLHQILTMTLRMALKHEKEKGFIQDFELKNEKKSGAEVILAVLYYFLL